MGGRVSLLLKEPKEQAWWTPLWRTAWRAYETRVQLLAERDGDEVVVSEGRYCKPITPKTVKIYGLLRMFEVRF
jgi:hypothetical protein